MAVASTSQLQGIIGLAPHSFVFKPSPLPLFTPGKKFLFVFKFLPLPPSTPGVKIF